MRSLLFVVFLAVAACADHQLKPIPAAIDKDSHAADSHDTAAGSTPKPSATEGEQHQQETVTVHPHVGGMGGAPKPPQHTAAGSTPKPSATEGQDHQQQQEPVTVHPHVGGMGGLPRPPHHRPGLHFPGLIPAPGFGQGFVPGFGQGLFPGFMPGQLPGFMPQLPFPGFGR